MVQSPLFWPMDPRKQTLKGAAHPLLAAAQAVRVSVTLRVAQQAVVTPVTSAGSEQSDGAWARVERMRRRRGTRKIGSCILKREMVYVWLRDNAWGC